MAAEVQIADTGSTAKTRDPLGVALLTLVTLGVYFFVWYYKVNREMSELGRARGTDELGDNPGNSLLAVTLGALIIVPAIVSMYNTFMRTQAAARLTGVEPLSGTFWNLKGLPFSSTPESVSPGPGTLSKIGTDPTTRPGPNDTPRLVEV